MVTSQELRQKYIEFFKARGHKEIPSASLVPENDPTVLFTTAGMHPLIPFLLGEPHPSGRRLVNFQKCVRTDDIDEVGDAFHHTFFEMLGNWSLGDYFKKETIVWSYEFLIQELRLDPDRIHITCFEGDENVPKDTESAEIWKSLGIPEDKIYFLGKKENFWGPVGESGPCGPDTEMHYDVTQKPCGPSCNPGDNCGRFSEIWNNVFMEYNKTKEGMYEPLKQKNVDTGMGLERTLAIVNKLDDDYQTELFQPIIQKIEELSSKKYSEYTKEFRIIADHIKAAVFLISEGIVSASQDQRGAVLRRLLNSASEEGRILRLEKNFLPQIGNIAIEIYQQAYPDLNKNRTKIEETLLYVEERIAQIRAKAPRNVTDLLNLNQQPFEQVKVKEDLFLSKYYGGAVSTDEFLQKHNFTSLASVYAGTVAFDAKTTSGYPTSDVREIVQGSLPGFKPNEFDETFQTLNQEHQKKSKISGEQLFKGGLADHSEEVTKYHTATHLLHAALRQILGSHVEQKGSNLTSERLRFDFSQPDKLTEEQIKQVENLVNEKIKENLPVTSEVMDKEKALQSGALAFFGEKYGDKVTVYTVGDFSREICGGPHVSSTGQLGDFKIIKEESAGAGIRRIYATLSS